jgi:hypothetical protein
MACLSYYSCISLNQEEKIEKMSEPVRQAIIIPGIYSTQVRPTH